MERFKQLRENNKFLRVVTNKYVVTTIIFLLLLLLVKNNNIIQFFGDYDHIYQQEISIQRYKDQIEKIESDIEHLSKDKDSIEKYAREKYYFQNKDEDLFIMENSN
jgi:cell division protein DivIC